MINAAQTTGLQMYTMKWEGVELPYYQSVSASYFSFVKPSSIRSGGAEPAGAGGFFLPRANVVAPLAFAGADHVWANGPTKSAVLVRPRVQCWCDLQCSVSPTNSAVLVKGEKQERLINSNTNN